METKTLTVAVTLPASAKEVFRTLTDEALHSAATGAESRITASQGGRFSYFDGAVSGTFEEIREGTRIVQKLRAANWPEGHYAVVRQELSSRREEGGCRVVVVEEGIPSGELDAVVEGWQSYWDAITRWLRNRRLEIVSRFIDEYKNRQNPDAVDEFVAEDCVLHGPIPDLPEGREGLRKNGQLMCGAFPDVHAERKFFVTEGEIVVERAEVRATHDGELMGIPPSGTDVTWTELHAYRLVDDRIAEIWSEADLAGVMRQIGADADAQAEANKEVIRRLYSEVMAKGNSEVADELFHPDYRDHMPIMETPDRAGLLKSVEAARRAFPDVKPRIIAEIAGGEWVAIAVEVDGGTHQDTYMGVPATGEPVSWTETHFWRVVDGRIVEHYGNVSLFEVHKMIGSHDIDGTLA